jgi:hypothetical protein
MLRNRSQALSSAQALDLSARENVESAYWRRHNSPLLAYGFGADTVFGPAYAGACDRRQGQEFPESISNF